MKVEKNYPNTNSRIFLLSKVRKVALVLLVIGGIVTGIVNLVVQGEPWALYVIGAEILFYMVFLQWPLVENSPIQKVTEVCSFTVLYLLLCDILIKGDLTTVVVPIILFSLIIIQCFFYFTDTKNKRRNFMPIMWLSSSSITLAVLAITGVLFINWQMITLGSVALASALISIIFFRKPILAELKKRFHLK